MLYIFLKKSKLSCYTYFLKFISKFKNTSQIYITMLIMAGDINSLNLLVDNVFHPKSLVLCPKVVLLLEYMVLTAFNINSPGFYRIHCNKCLFSL